MKWGFCGFGHIAKKFCTALQSIDGQTIVAVATKSKQAEVSEWIENCKVYSSYEALAQDDEVTIVYINTTHNFHVEQVLLFANAGKNVVCEKPMYIHRDEIKKLQAVTDSVFIMEALWSRFLPAYQFVKQKIDQGLIGQLTWMDVNFAFDNSDQPKDRLQNLDLAGGALLDIGVYPIQLALDLMNNEPPDYINAIASLNDHKVDITTSMILKWKNDFYANCFCSVDRIGRNEAVIYGKKGYITMKLFWMCEEVSITIDDTTEIHYFPHKVNGFEYQIEEAIQCIKDGKKQSSIMSLSHSNTIAEIASLVKEQIGYGL
ncbi:MAG TPA: Gfo/Idh/MocA family oxidoreductase [Saprospiraceae bacterium]|nr:Gfo/Idh/MocA family oxidoreductase [Saprospiraceae bacterium]